ncbi:hypothetical protein QN277_008040 [Acacia crassicarpa]|uniref:Uncharacterized protein n=1 Tax=Acacia crassicarpa TaxID=499986 RepID=A0AAE1IQQ1_9FABA|nr:hypothetical protein QN277_008040 [Acacia crassicarpa]
MYFFPFHSVFRQPSPPLLNAAVWTLLLFTTVVLASLAPVIAFTLALSPCAGGAGVSIPLQLSAERVCLPEHTVITRSHFDFFLPTLFATLVVGVSTCLLRSLAL